MADYRPIVIVSGKKNRMATADRLEAGSGLVSSATLPLVLSAGGQGVQVASGDDLQPAANVVFTKEVGHTVIVAASTTTNAAGGNLTVKAGDAQGSGTAGSLILRAGSGSPNGTVYLGDANTGAVHIATSSSIAHTVHIADAAAASTVTIGSTTGAASLTLQAGTGHFKVSGAASTNFTIGDTNTTGNITLGQSASSNGVYIANGALASGVTQTIVIGSNGAGIATHSVTIGNYGSNPANTLRLFCDQISFFGSGGTAAKQTVNGSRGNNLALKNLLIALATYGLITDNSS